MDLVLQVGDSDEEEEASVPVKGRKSRKPKKPNAMRTNTTFPRRKRG